MTTTFSPEELAKLPKWAREKVENIQRQRDEAINLATVRAGEPTGIELGYASSGDVHVYIPDDGQEIRFNVEAKHGVKTKIGVSRRRHGLNIMASEGCLVVQSQSSNVVHVICQEWTP